MKNDMEAENSKCIIGEPTAAVVETIYITPVAIGGEMFEFQTRYRKTAFVPDGGVCKDTDLRRGKMRRAQLEEIRPKIEEEVRRYAEQ